MINSGATDRPSNYTQILWVDPDAPLMLRYTVLAEATVTEDNHRFFMARLDAIYELCSAEPPTPRGALMIVDWRSPLIQRTRNFIPSPVR